MYTHIDMEEWQNCQLLVAFPVQPTRVVNPIKSVNMVQLSNVGNNVEMCQLDALGQPGRAG